MKQTPERFGRRAVLRIVLVYAAFAALWIFLSDFALVLLVRDTVALTRLAMIKGVLFILVTAGLLYLMIRETPTASRASRRLAGTARPGSAPTCRALRWPYWCSTAAAAAWTSIPRPPGCWAIPWNGR